VKTRAHVLGRRRETGLKAAPRLGS